jgi:PAS domain S-box-containing protein
MKQPNRSSSARLPGAAKTRLLEEHRRLTQVFDDSPAFICTLRGPEHVFELANKQYFSLVGRDDILGKPVAEALPEIVGQGFADLLDRVYSTGEKYIGNEIKVALQRDEDEDLEDRYVDFVYQPLTEEDGSVSGIFVHGVDITEQVLARKRAEESEVLFKTYAEAMPQMAFMASADGAITFFNKRWYDYVDGMEGTEGWGWRDKPIHHPDDLERAIARWTRSLRTGEPYEIEYRLRRHDGEYRWHLGRALPLRDEQGTITNWLGTNTDIHDQKRAMEQRDQFIGIASHELKTPVTSLKAYGQVLQRMCHREGNERAAQLLGKMDGQIDRLTALISDLLDVTKIQSGKLVMHQQMFDPVTLVHDIVEELQLTATNHRIECTMDDEGEVLADRERIGQVITNLLSNAIKYSPGADRVRIALTRPPGEVMVSVTDYGVGIPEAKKDKVFEQFFRVNGDSDITVPGLGLGLYISSEIIKRHGGRIWVESEMGKGSTFAFSIPDRRSV